ncbi:DUF928 domain-containing protein [Microseira sp. BLCC-F43]|uniref:DUF928 domain-containing protein n=1 Tax=Microseira sp. BLCC-F43 TaxID=3153602 RepID=UPI0035BA901A
MSNYKLFLRQISVNLFLALTIVQPSLAAPRMGKMPIRQDKSTPEFNPTTTGALSDRQDAGGRNHPPSPTRLEYDPPQRGAPGDRNDAGSRGSEELLALVPVNKYGWTTAEYPTFWFYLKRQTSSTSTIKLELIDENQKVVYQTTLALTQTEGIMHITLPKTAPRLEIGKQYQWVIFSGNMDNEMHASGWIERVALTPELASQLQQAKPRERVLIFAKKGFWYETITELAALRRANPQDAQLADDWVALLQDPDVSLKEIISQRLVPCCTP